MKILKIKFNIWKMDIYKNLIFDYPSSQEKVFSLSLGVIQAWIKA